jgi:hypothetical protein
VGRLGLVGLLGRGLAMLTGTTAQTLHDKASALGVLLVWLVSDADPEHPGKVVARSHTADSKGAVYLAARWWRTRWTSCTQRCRRS